MGIFNNNGRLPEVTFNLENDFEEDVYQNSKLLFGENTILLDTKTLLRGNILGGTIPDGFLFDLTDVNEPQFYLIEVELAKHSFNSHIFPQITKFFAFFKNQQQRQSLTEKLYEVITNDKNILSQFKKHIGNQEVFKFLKDVIENSQNILIVIDGEKSEIADISEVYTDTWGKMVKHIVLRKYSDGDNTVYHLEPDFEVLEIVGDEKVVAEKASYDEAHHTDGIPEDVVSIFQELKTRVLEINSEIIFNPTKSYISIKKNKNIAFISLKKKHLRLVALRPESEVRENISHYEIQSFPESVKKFWGGECAGILVPNSSGMDELINLLHPLIHSDED
jgi:hypothetical protein